MVGKRCYDIILIVAVACDRQRLAEECLRYPVGISAVTSSIAEYPCSFCYTMSILKYMKRNGVGGYIRSVHVAYCHRR
jgi:hypothetical protein